MTKREREEALKEAKALAIKLGYIYEDEDNYDDATEIIVNNLD